MTSLILALLDRLKGLFRALGADYPQLRAIVEVKLTMDSRRSTITLGNYGRHSAESSNAFVKTLGLYAFFGALISAAMLLPADRDTLFFPLTFLFGFIMSLCAMTLISDFSSVILDSSDNQIILPRPVGNRTLWLARVVHIVSYLSAIALSLSVVGVLIVGYRFGALAGVTMLITALLSAMLMVFLTNVFYLLLMRFISEERLREVINYVQIVLAVVFYGGYQFLPRLMNRTDWQVAVVHSWWHYVVPPMWMAGAVEMTVRPAFDQPHLLFLLLALITPFAGLWATNRFLTGNFSQQLSRIDQESRPIAVAGASTERFGPVANRLAGWFSCNSLERTAFLFTWRITGRDRKFKLKTYPQLGFALAYTVAMSFQRDGLGQTQSFYLFALYFAGIYVMVAQYQLSASDNYRASWVYGSAPIHKPGDVLAGSLKSLIVKLLTPFYAVLSTYILYQYGLDKLADVVLAYGNSLLMLMCSSLLSTRYMPFSVAQDALKQNNTARGFLIAIVLSVVGFSHYGLTLVPYGVWVAIPVSAGLVWYLFRQYRQTGWEQIEMG